MQFHVDNKPSEGLEAAGIPIVEYDGGITIWAKSLDELMAIFYDDGYLRVVPDEENFLKGSEAKMILGWDEDLWAHGKAVEGVLALREEDRNFGQVDASSLEIHRQRKQ